jgi:hypothetical protein
MVGQENERFFVVQAELEKQFAVLAAQLEGPVSEFVSDPEHEQQDQIVRDFFDVARRLRKNAREICRFLRRREPPPPLPPVLTGHASSLLPY